VDEEWLIYTIEIIAHVLGYRARAARKQRPDNVGVLAAISIGGPWIVPRFVVRILRLMST
jgi:hypothetical protein